MPNHKPVHKLPYTYRPTEPRPGTSVFVVCQSLDPNIMGYFNHALVQKDLEYLIHAGNAYPKIVEALKRIVAYYENYVDQWMPIEDAESLLIEIGEAE